MQYQRCDKEMKAQLSNQVLTSFHALNAFIRRRVQVRNMMFIINISCEIKASPPKILDLIRGSLRITYFIAFLDMQI